MSFKKSWWKKTLEDPNDIKFIDVTNGGVDEFIPSDTASKSEVLDAECRRKRQKELKDQFTVAFNNLQGLSEPEDHEKPRAVTELDIEIDSAISGAAPQIIKPEIRPEPKPLSVTDLTPISSTKPEDALIGLHSYGKGWITDKETLAKWQDVIEDAQDTIYNPPIIDDWEGQFQPSLKPPTTSPNLNFVTSVSIGNPRKGILLNCIENSRGELIYFKNNEAVVKAAIEKFNKEYDKKSRSKIILAGENDKEYINFRLTFNNLDYALGSIFAKFEKWEYVTGKGNEMVDYVDFIKENCQFYLEGEIILNESETTIESMEIFGMNYINQKRMRHGDKFIYI